MLTIHITDIAAMPAATILPRDWDYVNICWVKTWDGLEVELLFDEYGNPLLDELQITRIANYFGKHFRKMKIDGELIYGMKVGR